MIKPNKKGVALIVVLILSVIALALVGTTLSLVRNATKTSGLYSSYQTSLEAAKGGVDLSIAKLLSIDCDNSSLSGNLDIGYTTLGNYNIFSKVLKKYHYITVDSTTGNIENHCIYAIEVTAKSPNTKEKSIIDIVLRIDQ